MKDNLETIRKSLMARKMELEQELTRLSQERFSDGQVQDPGDQALSSTMESLQVSLQDTEREEYNRILLAIEKVDDGTYGICSDCGQPISEKRLKSYQNAARCIVCQEAFEENPFK
ncbi:MAG: TraR/DksA family transcriptional regulator [Candidatus Dependentiae bacterium]|nr:TraR/DksA family transcriptional regulator [Candidatus Dependentiae bacterium]